MNRRISSETEFIFKIVPQVLAIPFVLILVLFRRRKIKDVFKPFGLFLRYVAEPRFTWLMMLANVLIFVIGIFTFYRNEALLYQLVNAPSDLLTFRSYTFITAGFIHASVMHLVGNMIALFIFGRVVEREYGSLWTAYIYGGALIISGVFSAVVHILLGQNPIGVGASGAIMGLVATAMLVRPLYLTYYTIFPLPIMVLGWMYLIADISGMLSGSTSGIGHLAHLGGFFSIALLVYLFHARERARLKMGLFINILSVVALWVAFIAYKIVIA